MRARDVRAEHLAAVESMTGDQWAAVNRLWRAYGSPRQDRDVLFANLNRIFETEAIIRSTPGAGIA
jgi:hypothetical protein